MKMGYTDFVKKLAEQNGIESAEVLLRDYRQRFSFQLNNRHRGKDYCARLTEFISVPISQLRILDIGCGHGGISIELANRGAKVVGVEVNSGLLDLAYTNALNECAPTFIQADASSPSMQKSVDSIFDIVILHDVMEHIYDTVGLMENINNMTHHDSVLLIVVPNGQSMRYVRSEGHKGVFGISLLDPDCWQYFVKGRTSIYYRKWPYFVGLLVYYGFFEIYRKVSDVAEGGAEEVLQVFLDLKAFKNAEIDLTNLQSNIQSLLNEAFNKLENEIHEDIKILNRDDLNLKYLTNFWEVVAAKSNRLLNNEIVTGMNWLQESICNLK